MATLHHEYSLDSAISYSFNAQPEAPAGLAKKPDFGWDAMFGSTEGCCSPSAPPRSRHCRLQPCCHLPLGRSDAVAAGRGWSTQPDGQGLSPTLSESGERQISFVFLWY